MGAIASTTLALTMIAAALLLILGARQAMALETRQRGWLMIACGIVFVGNVLIWTL